MAPAATVLLPARARQLFNTLLSPEQSVRRSPPSTGSKMIRGRLGLVGGFLPTLATRPGPWTRQYCSPARSQRGGRRAAAGALRRPALPQPGLAAALLLRQELQVGQARHLRPAGRAGGHHLPVCTGRQRGRPAAAALPLLLLLRHRPHLLHQQPEPRCRQGGVRGARGVGAAGQAARSRARGRRGRQQQQQQAQLRGQPGRPLLESITQQPQQRALATVYCIAMPLSSLVGTQHQ